MSPKRQKPLKSEALCLLFVLDGFVEVVRPGLEPGLFSSKGKRVASYTIGQESFPEKRGAKLENIQIQKELNSGLLNYPTFRSLSLILFISEGPS